DVAELEQALLVTIDAVLARGALRKRLHLLERLADRCGQWPAVAGMVRAHAADDLGTRFLHAGEPSPGEIGPSRRPGRGEQNELQDDDDGQDIQCRLPHTRLNLNRALVIERERRAAR